MSSFLYFLPIENGPSSEQIEEIGLRRIVGKKNPNAATSAGPDDQDGRLIAFPPDSSEGKIADQRYEPERQTWKKSRNGLYYVGFWNDSRPTPEDLIRDSALSGDSIELIDQRYWEIPKARAFEGLQATQSIPLVLELNSEGQWGGSLHPDYADLNQYADMWLSHLMGSVEYRDGVQIDVMIQAVLCALATNYRLGPEEISLLRLLDTEKLSQILDLVVDYPSIERELEARSKKKGTPSRGSSTTPGESVAAGSQSPIVSSTGSETLTSPNECKKTSSTSGNNG